MLSETLHNRLERLLYVGFFTSEEAHEKKMRLVIGKEQGIAFYWLVDEADGVIADTKFQAFGPISLIAAAEISCELILRKTYDQASRVSPELLEYSLRDRQQEADETIFTAQFEACVQRAVHALHDAARQCTDIPCASVYYEETPIADDAGEYKERMQGWDLLSSAQKREAIHNVIEKEILPYIALDAGGVKVVDFTNDTEVHIVYEGACTTCYSATGSTLSAIQRILRERLDPSLVVIPR